MNQNNSKGCCSINKPDWNASWFGAFFLSEKAKIGHVCFSDLTIKVCFNTLPTMQYKTIQQITMKYDAKQYCRIWYNTVQYGMMQNNATQHNI